MRRNAAYLLIAAILAASAGLVVYAQDHTDLPHIFNAACTFLGVNVYTGANVHSGAETHAGAEVFASGGSLSFSGTGYVNHLVSHRNRVEFFDDFLGDLIEDGWNTQADAGGSIALATAPGTGGVLTLTTDTTDDDTIMVAHELNWKASQGLVFEARLKIDVITTVALFVGLTDAKVETSPNLPIGRQTTVSVATADNAAGFVFDIDSTTDVLFGSGVKATTLIADQGASAALVAATYVVLRIEISTAGAASFYVDGTQIGATTANAVTTTTPLTPYIGMANRGAAAHVLSVDYVYVSGARP